MANGSMNRARPKFRITDFEMESGTLAMFGYGPLSWDSPSNGRIQASSKSTRQTASLTFFSPVQCIGGSNV
jgi:hypothetical protein